MTNVQSALCLQERIKCAIKSLRSQDSHSLILTENGLALYRSDLSLHVCTQK